MSDKPIRVQRRRTKGWKMPPNTVCVTRPGPFGNPYRVGEVDGAGIVINSEWAVKHFAFYLRNDLHGEAIAERARKELRGKNLACFCPLDKPCHADVLLEIANA